MISPQAFPLLAALSLLSPLGVRALCDAECAHHDNGAADDFKITYEGRCTPQTAVTDGKLPAAEHACLVCLYNVAQGALETDISVVVRELCLAGYAANEYPYGDITRRGAQFDREHYAGGGEWNYEVETADGEDRLKEDAARVYDIYHYQAQRQPIEFPTHIESFNPYVEDGSNIINNIADTDGCDLNAAFCCFAQDRQAGDNNGNCATPYEYHCYDKDPADNTNICYVDHARSPKSSRVDSGFSIFGDLKTNKENIEGAVHCHGFAWGDDPLSVDNVYKGNLLFYVSMYDHLTQRGYARNIPGSPMCACAENMAVVTRADCTQISAEEKTSFEWTASTNTLVAAPMTKDLDFNACQGLDANNNLQERVKKLHALNKISEAKKDAVGEILVGSKAGNCNAAIEKFLGTKNITRYGGATSVS